MTVKRTEGSRFSVGSSRIIKGLGQPKTQQIDSFRRIPVDIKATRRERSRANRSAYRIAAVLLPRGCIEVKKSMQSRPRIIRKSFGSAGKYPTRCRTSKLWVQQSSSWTLARPEVGCR